MLPRHGTTGRRLRHAIVAVGLACASPALAQPDPAPPATDAPSIWTRSAYKTLTYEIATVLIDQALFESLTPVGTAVGATFLTANLASAAVFYFAHDVAWTASGADLGSQAATAYKTASYGAVTLARNFGLAFAFTGDANVSAAYAALSTAAETAIFVANEWIWNTVAP